MRRWLIRCRSLGIVKTNATRSARTSAARRIFPESPLAPPDPPLAKENELAPKMRAKRRNTTSVNPEATEFSRLEVTATADLRPCFWKKRTSSAKVVTPPPASPVNFVPISSIRTGRNGSGLLTEPRSERAMPPIGTHARAKTTGTQTHSASLNIADHCTFANWPINKYMPKIVKPAMRIELGATRRSSSSLGASTFVAALTALRRSEQVFFRPLADLRLTRERAVVWR